MSSENSLTQLPLFDNRPSIEHPEFSERIRRAIHEGVEYLSLVDIMAEFVNDPDTTWQEGKKAGQKKKLLSSPRIVWQYTKKRLVVDGFDVYRKTIQLKLEAKDGKMYKTDCATVDTCMRIVQSIPSPKAEPIREWLASLGAREIDEARHPEKAVARRIHELQKYERAGYGNAAEIRRLRERHEGIDSLKQLKDLIAQVCDNPNYAQIMNAEYLAMFGEIASELKRILNTSSIRDALPPLQLQYLKTAEYGLLELIKQANLMDMEQILQTIDLIVRPLGEHLKQVSDMLGVHHITGQKLLNSG